MLNGIKYLHNQDLREISIRDELDLKPSIVFPNLESTKSSNRNFPLINKSIMNSRVEYNMSNQSSCNSLERNKTYEGKSKKIDEKKNLKVLNLNSSLEILDEKSPSRIPALKYI